MAQLPPVQPHSAPRKLSNLACPCSRSGSALCWFLLLSLKTLLLSAQRPRLVFLPLSLLLQIPFSTPSSLCLVQPGSRPSENWKPMTKTTVSTEILMITSTPLAVHFPSLASQSGLYISSSIPHREKYADVKSTTARRTT